MAASDAVVPALHFDGASCSNHWTKTRNANLQLIFAADFTSVRYTNNKVSTGVMALLADRRRVPGEPFCAQLRVVTV